MELEVQNSRKKISYKVGWYVEMEKKFVGVES
jgi:hypothetical protein